jgi:hypothetical protein
LNLVSPAPSFGLHRLEPEDRRLLCKLVDQKGVAGAARQLDVSRSVVVQAAGNFGVRKGSLEMLREALAKHREAVK